MTMVSRNLVSIYPQNQNNSFCSGIFGPAILSFIERLVLSLKIKKYWYKGPQRSDDMHRYCINQMLAVCSIRKVCHK